MLEKIQSPQKLRINVKKMKKKVLNRFDDVWWPITYFFWGNVKLPRCKNPIFGVKEWEFFQKKQKMTYFWGGWPYESGSISGKNHENSVKKLKKVCQCIFVAEIPKIKKIACRDICSCYEFPNLHGFFGPKFPIF